ncbi:guanine nucleotide exchange factor MSS4-like [Xenia sp. Carnegie-2017]|uniref:guanine nucleotide exchange factor MSS4-like n=1 Tax=Xenia sp. Carnegie-2017 TaxID=2897299 RepID=UPI001F04EEE1|nr:guanine nucleotide exchange factor MSS4-like [Xenia sp. Carnegie-2017]
MKPKKFAKKKLIDTSELVNSSNKKNRKWLLCPYCDSKILPPNKGEYLEKEQNGRNLFIIFIFSMCFLGQQQNMKYQLNQRELLSQYWLVIDMFTFENVGFTKTVGTTKYLICADCEIGPIGFVNLEDKSKHYVALSRVKYR